MLLVFLICGLYANNEAGDEGMGIEGLL